MSEKKVTNIKGTAKPATNDAPTWQPTAQNKGKANRLRLFAGLAWLAAIAAQIGAIYYITHTNPIKLWLPIVIIVVDAAFAITGGILWKKSNHIDPPSEANKFLFFMQSQLGIFIAIIAFLPLVVLIFTNKNMDKKQKGILATVAILLMGAAGLMGTDFNPASVEKYQAQSEVVKQLTGQDLVYGTKSGSKYHLYKDCQYLKSDNVKELFQGTVADIHAKNTHIKTDADALCSACEKRALKAKGLTKDELNKAVSKQAA